MKNLIRVITVTLTLALLLAIASVFAFAEDGAESDCTVVTNIDYSSDASTPSNHSSRIDEKANAVYKEITGGEAIRFAYHNKISGANPYGQFLLDLTDTSAAIKAYNEANEDESTESGYVEGFTPAEPNSVLNNPYINVAVGKVVANNTKDNRVGDFLVLDFDISTDTVFPSNWTVTSVVRPYNSTSGKYESFAGERFIITTDCENVDDGFKMLVKRDGAGTLATLRPVVEPQNGWVNFTMIVDLTANNGTAYFYLDGYYVGTANKFCGSNGAYLEGFRINVAETKDITTEAGALDDVVSSLNLDNISVRTYKTGAQFKTSHPSVTDGSTVSLLGSAAIQLDQLGLDYVYENFPGEIVPYVKDSASKGAFTVQRGEETLHFISVTELEKNLQSGDVVTVNRDVEREILVLHENVTFNTGDFTCDTVTLASLTAKLGEEPDWIIRNTDTGAVLDYGIQVQTNVDNPEKNGVAAFTDTDTYVDWNDTDALADAVAAQKSNPITVFLLDDIKYGKKVSDIVNLVFDLNGRTLTVNGSLKQGVDSNTFYVAKSNNFNRIVFRNGNLVIDNKSCSITNFSQNYDRNYFVFEDLNLTYNGGGNVDHRGGCVAYRNVDVTVTGGTNYIYRMSSRDGDRIPVGLRIDNCTFNLELKLEGELKANSYFAFNNLSTGGKKYGAAFMNVYVKDSAINNPRSANGMFQLTNYANTATYSDGSAVRDDYNMFLLTADNSTLNAAGKTVFNVVNGTVAEGMFNNNVFAAKNGSKLAGNLVTNKLDAAYGKVTLDFEEGTFAAPNTTAVGATLPEGTLFAKTNSASDKAYNYVLTSDYIPYSWTLAGQTTSENWLATDTLTESDYPVTLPTATAAYKYAWVSGDGRSFTATPSAAFKPQHNLTLYSDFNLNIFLPADAVIASVTLDGEEAEGEAVNVNGTDYLKYAFTGIHPSLAAQKHTMVVTVNCHDTDVITPTLNVSVLDYARAILNSDDAEYQSVKPLIAEAVDYVASAYSYAGNASTEAEQLLASEACAKHLLADEDRKTLEAVDTMDKVASAIDSARLNIAGSFRFVFTVNKDYNGQVSFTYYSCGEEITVTRNVKGGDTVELAVKAYDVRKTVKVTAGGQTGEYNLAAYLNFAEGLTDGNRDLLVALVNDLLDYAQAAEEYKATLA